MTDWAIQNFVNKKEHEASADMEQKGRKRA
jgi:hypothetical protein